jgi:hypothetical protein
MNLLRGVFLAVALALVAHAQQPLSLDAPVESFQLPRSIPPCGLATALARLARSNPMLVGLERAPGCAANEYPTLDLSDADRLNDVSKRVVLDRIVAMVPDYSWREVEGVAVVRPVSAWSDLRSLLAARVPAFRGPYDATIPHLMNTVFRRPDNPPDKRTMADKQMFPATFSGGTLLQGLNALIRGAQLSTTSAEWTFRQDDDVVDIEIWTLFEPQSPGADAAVGVRPVYFSERRQSNR